MSVYQRRQQAYYRSPSGKEFQAHSDSVGSELAKKVAAFAVLDGDGAAHQDRGLEPAQYSLDFVFYGEDCDLQGREFEAAIAERGAGQLDKVTKILQTLQQSLQTPVNEPGNGSPSAFQAALLTALGTLQLPDYSQVESDKVLHGAGSSTGTDGNSVAGSGQESQASGDQEGSTLGDQNSDTVGIFELET